MAPVAALIANALPVFPEVMDQQADVLLECYDSEEDDDFSPDDGAFGDVLSDAESAASSDLYEEGDSDDFLNSFWASFL